MTDDDQRQIQTLARQLSEARAWAWSEYHRSYDARWLQTRNVSPEDGGWDWLVPDWLSSNVEPQFRPWFVPPSNTDPHPTPSDGP